MTKGNISVHIRNIKKNKHYKIQPSKYSYSEMYILQKQVHSN